MDSTSTPRTRRRLRWAVPVGTAALVVAGTAGAGLLESASADATLAPRTPAQLLVDVQQARLAGISGTVVQTSELGLPDITLPGMGGAGGSSELSSTVTGTHTWRIWYAGPDKARLALIGSGGESDIVRNGKDLWLWSSGTKSATHYALDADTAPSGAGSLPSPVPSELPSTPQQAADAALAALQPTTEVSVPGTTTVAGRSAYELVLRPRQSGTLVAQVRIAVDAAQRIPLRVQVFSTSAATPAFEVGFTSVDFTVPGDRQFDFTPPPGTRVSEGGTAEHSAPSGAASPAARAEPHVVGTGWTSVAVGTLPTGGGSGTDGSGGTGSGIGEGQAMAQLQGVLGSLPEVSGSWGSGRLLAGTLFSAVITDDGRFAVGSVAPESLYSALATR